MKCPECRGKRFLTDFTGERMECWLCRSLGVVTPEANRQWLYEQEQERIRQIRLQLARDAMESTQWEQLAFAWDDAPAKVKVEKPKKPCCVTLHPLPSTMDHRQPSLAFEEPSEIHGHQHGTHAPDLVAY